MGETVNKAVEELVSERYGARRWQQVRDRAGLGREASTPSSDAPVMELLGVTGDVLAIPRPAMMEAFGRHWVLNGVRKSNGGDLNLEGRSLGSSVDEIPELLEKLSPLADGVKKSQFKISDRSPQSFRLDLRVTDSEWTPLVVGMLLGLGEVFRSAMRIERVGDPGAADGVERLFVQWTELRKP